MSVKADTRLVSVPQLAAQLSTSPEFLYGEISRGKLRAADLGRAPRGRTVRISRDEVVRWLTERAAGEQ